MEGDAPAAPFAPPSPAAPTRRGPDTAVPFRALVSTAGDWIAIADDLIAQIADAGGGTAAILYVTDLLAPELGSLVTRLRSTTGIKVWGGCTAIGVMAGREDFFDHPAAVCLLCQVPAGRMVPFGPSTAPPDSALGGIALVHANPTRAEVARLLPRVADRHGLFMVGGLASSRGPILHVSGTTVSDAAYSGLWLDPALGVASGLSQGCTPIGPVHTVDMAEGTIIERLDGRPALDVFRQDIGELLARDLRRTAGFILAALPVGGSDTGDYLVRNLIGFDERGRRLAIGAEIRPGDRLLFVRRDHTSAIADLKAMVTRLRSRAPAPILAAVYVSCLGRGPNMVPDGAEPALVQEILGDVPLVGFYANGELSHDRLYGYTGVLTVLTGR